MPQVNAAEQQTKEQQKECDVTYCLESGDFNFAVGIGYGTRTNPLNFSDNRTLLIIPDIAWYGDNWYLDNTEIGYQWIQQDRFALETFVTLNNSKRDFEKDHPSNFVIGTDNLFESVGGDNPTAGPTDFPTGTPESPSDENDGEDEGPSNATARFSPDDVSDRDYAIDVGIRAHWYQDSNEWTLALYHDASGVYEGAQAALQYRRLWQPGQWQISTQVGLRWKSADLLDYYYGVDSEDIADTALHYDADAGWFANVGLTAHRKIAEQWHWMLHVSYTHLPDEMIDSPLVEEDHTITTFAGVTYRF